MEKCRDAFEDLLPPTEDVDDCFKDYAEGLSGVDSARSELYALCKRLDAGLTVMKPYAGGRLFDAQRSPFGAALTPVQCIHYCPTRPAGASVLCGYDTPEQVEAAAACETPPEAERDYTGALAAAPRHSYGGGECTCCLTGNETNHARRRASALKRISSYTYPRSRPA